MEPDKMLPAAAAVKEKFQKKIAYGEDSESRPQQVGVAILFIVFNRPEPTAKVFSAIRDARPPRLYIALDGPREGRVEDIEKISSVRSIIENVEWPCQVTRLYRKINLGCKKAVSQAINWFFDHEEMGIILEDDTLPEARFFPFIEHGLRIYRDNQEVGAICGYNIRGENPGRNSVFASYPHIWGWGTWRRVWRDYKVDLHHSEAEFETVFRCHIKHRRAAKQLAMTGNLVRKGQFNSWDFQFGFLLCGKQLLSLYPPFNLVQNIGFGSDATHTLKGCSVTLYKNAEWPEENGEPVLDREFDRARFAIEFPGRVARVKNLLARLVARLFVRSGKNQ